MGEGGGSGPGEGQWPGGPKGDGCWPWDRGRWPRVRGQESGDDLRAGRLPCDYASSDGRSFSSEVAISGVEMAVTSLEIREDHDQGKAGW